MSDVSDADRIRADGIPVTLADGSTLQLRFDFEALLTIERRLGSLTGLTKNLDSGLDGSVLEALLVAVAAAGHRSEDELMPLLDSTQLAAYKTAVIEGLAVSFGRPGSGKESAPGSGSPGPTSTTPPPSDSGGATTPSGG